VTHTEHIAKSASLREAAASTPKTGLFATLSNLLRSKGTGAPSSTRSSGIGAPSIGGRLSLRLGTLIALITLVVAAAFCAATPTITSAATPAPHWTVESFASPTNFAAGQKDSYQVTARDAGSLATTENTTITLTDTLPEGLTEREVVLIWPGLAKALEVFGANPETNLVPVMNLVAGFSSLGAEAIGCAVSASPTTISCFVNPTKLNEFFAGFGLPAPCKGTVCGVAPDEEIKLTPSVAFDEPIGIAVDPVSGDLVVLDETGASVLAFNQKGEFLHSFGGAGAGNGQLNHPGGVAVDSKGNVWVADTANNRVQEFSGAGTSIGATGWNVVSSGPDAANQTAFTATTAAGSTTLSEVSAFTGSVVVGGVLSGPGIAPGTTITAVNEAGNELTISAPATATATAAALSASNGFEVCKAGADTCRAGFAGGAAGQFNAPKGLTVDGKGDVWVADSANNRVQELGEKGEFIQAEGWNVVASGPDAANPTAFTANTESGSTTLTEVSAFTPSVVVGGVLSGPGIAPGTTITEVNEAGKELTISAPATATATGAALSASNGSEVCKAGVDTCRAGLAGAGNGQFSDPESLALDGKGNVWVADTANNRVQELTEAGAFLRASGAEGTGNGQFKEPRGIAVDSTAHVRVLDTGNDRVQELGVEGEYLSQFGTKGAGSGQLSAPRGIALDAAGNVWVADSANIRVQQFSQAGEFVTAFGAYRSSTLTNSAEVSGGGAPAAATDPAANPVSATPAAFGPSNFDFRTASLDGSVDSQAGDHPYELTVTGGFDNGPRREYPQGLSSVKDVRDVVVNLPVGFVGSILAAPRCTFSELSSHVAGGEGGCPASTIVGHIQTFPVNGTSIDGPIYNMTPEKGLAAEFAYVDLLAGPHVFYSRVVPTSKGYVLQTINPDVPQIELYRFAVSFYGDPALRDASLVCGSGSEPQEVKCRETLKSTQVPFFTNPTDCAGEEPTATMFIDSWQNPAHFNPDGTPVSLSEPQWASRESKSPPVIGCNALQFPAELKAQPTTKESDKPSGLDMEIKLPQSETVGVPATPTMKRAIVTFPEGFTVDPAAGGGLAACTEAQIGWTGPTHLDFTAAPPACPPASKIGTLELETPLIPGVLHGEMFLSAQNENPFGSLIGLYVVVHDPVTGVLVKIAGKATLDPHTGRITSEFDENPNVPFSDLKLHFFGGPRAEFATPESCGSFTVNTQLFPYSLEENELPATPSASFQVDEACPGGFAPTFTAGSTNLQAGAYTPFVASFGRSDTDQELAGLTLTLPPGLLGKIAGVPLCTDAQIEAIRAGTGGCPENSLVGTTQAGAGPGPNPLFVGGKAYLTGPYNGGPYGLAVVVPAVAGPFNFGTVVVRQSLRIDPHTAQVTDVSDPFPTIIDGIPLRLRRVDVTLNRPEFTFNPTSCEHEQFTGAISGSPLGAPTTLAATLGYATQPGSTSPFTAPFQVTNCANLKFTPTVSVSTAGRASKVNGASLTFKIAYPRGAMGSQAWFNEAKFDIPKQLPARLTTIQKACLAAVFEKERQNCPAASKIGHAVVRTQVLPTPLEGPVYFVSYGGAKFPDAVLVLDGSNVHIELHGETFIDGKTGVTSATFRNTPDVPFEAIEVTVPQGKFSEFGVNLPKGGLSFCGQHLTMPTLFKASNGLEINQNTPVAVTGCKGLTGAQKLAAALKACHKKHGKNRAACERAARKKFGPLKKHGK